VPAVNALVCGDTLSDFGEGMHVALGGRTHVTEEQIKERLQPLLDLPVELVLPAHGEPGGRELVEQVLAR
jgi:hypothetical protein